MWSPKPETMPRKENTNSRNNIPVTQMDEFDPFNAVKVFTPKENNS